jgi:hypothetical protein
VSRVYWHNSSTLSGLSKISKPDYLGVIETMKVDARVLLRPIVLECWDVLDIIKVEFPSLLDEIGGRYPVILETFELKFLVAQAFARTDVQSLWRKSRSNVWILLGPSNRLFQCSRSSQEGLSFALLSIRKSPKGYPARQEAGRWEGTVS